jgi:hypothetical protein
VHSDKRISRLNITIRNKERQREVESKRKARQCEEIRQKECVEKRLSRQNIKMHVWYSLKFDPQNNAVFAFAELMHHPYLRNSRENKTKRNFK